MNYLVFRIITFFLVISCYSRLIKLKSIFSCLHVLQWYSDQKYQAQYNLKCSNVTMEVKITVQIKELYLQLGCLLPQRYASLKKARNRSVRLIKERHIRKAVCASFFAKNNNKSLNLLLWIKQKRHQSPDKTTTLAPFFLCYNVNSAGLKFRLT